MRAEAIRVAAMAVRFVADVLDVGVTEVVERSGRLERPRRKA